MINSRMLAGLFLMPAACAAMAQDYAMAFPTGEKAPTVLVPSATVKLDCAGGCSHVPVLSNAGDYKVTPVWEEGTSPWFEMKQQKNGWEFQSEYWYKRSPRYGKLLVEYPGGKSEEIQVVQSGNDAMTSILPTTVDLRVETGEAPKENSTLTSIAKSYDGITSTSYQSKTGVSFPVTLTYELAYPAHIDSMTYVPRLDSPNGRWGRISVAYATRENPETFTEVVTDYDCKFTDRPVHLALGKDGADNVSAVRVTVNTAKNNMVSCAEISFLRENEAGESDFNTLFADALCSRLKPGVGEEQLKKATHPLAKQLGYYLLKENYDTAYRVATFEPYEALETLAKRMKTSTYNPYENPTGICLEKGVGQVILAEGIDERYPVYLTVKDFGKEGGQPESRFQLHNGMNVIEPTHKGHGYVSYYTADFEKAPKIRLHFVLGKVNGYFDLQRGDTNEDWVKLLASACSDILDLRTPHLQVAFPTARFRQNCPTQGVELAQLLDSVVYYERDVMGFFRYGISPKNRQFARVIWNGYMWADGVGAAIHDDCIPDMTTVDRTKFGFWGLAHELGHVNQVRPGLKWSGLGEVTNNIYSAWVELKLSQGRGNWDYRMDGINDYRTFMGGRFNCYLEEGVRKGGCWLTHRGPDFGEPTKEITIANEDYEGRPTGKDTTLLCGPSDHFVKLAPLWQLQLYCEAIGASPGIYAKVCESVRNTDESRMSNGQLQMKFMRTVCDSSRLNFLPFFEKAGMLKPICQVMDDYGYGWLKISEQMINDLKRHVEEEGYPTPEGELNYITSQNYMFYSEKRQVEGELNVGCSPVDMNGYRYIKVDHRFWKNAVAYETYDRDGRLLRISMYGLGAPANSFSPYTMVLWPRTAQEQSAYVMAVSWDGKRVRCYTE